MNWMLSTYSFPNLRVRKRKSFARPATMRGTTLIELILVLPLFLALCLGTWEFAYFYSVKNLIQSSAREGARAGIPWNSKLADVVSAVNTSLIASGQSSANYTITVKDGNGAAVSDMTSVNSGANYEVIVSADWGSVGGGFRPLGMISTSRFISGSCTMKREY